MAPPTLTLLAFSVLTTLLLALALAMLAMWVWVLWRLWRGIPLLAVASPIHRRPAPWGGMTVFVVIVLYVVVNISVTHLYSAVTGRRPPSAAGSAVLVDAAKPEAPDEEKQGEARAQQSQQEILLQLAIINSVLLLFVPALLRLTCHARLTDLGFQTLAWRRQLAIGAGSALVLTPGVYAIQSLAVRLWRPRAHPVEEMVLERFTLEVALLALVSTMLLAPLIEEMLFRGVLQRWLWSLFGVLQHWLCRLFGEQFLQSGADAPKREMPELAIGGELPAVDEDSGLPSERPTERPGACGASSPTSWASVASILMTSLGFAAVHMAQWPAPVAIFLLSVGLGTVYVQTGSLLAAVAMHGTFNGFSTLLLLWEALGRQIYHSP
jgi:membrane protease YdiL (CAAX protease family)